MAVGLVMRDATTAPFFDGTARGEFLLRRCVVCGTYSQPQAEQCSSCDSQNLTWEPSTGSARVVTWAVVHSKPRDGVSDVEVVAVGELDEGPWWWAQILDVEPNEVFLGMRVKIDFEVANGSDEYVPVFRSAGS